MKRTYISAAVMVLLGTGVFFGSELYQPQPVAVLTKPVPESIEETAEEAVIPLSAPPEETEEPFLSSPTELNLSHIFPEGADSSDLTKSYAGEAFRILMTQDENWMSEIYDYSDYAPLNLASRLGRSREQVLGRYNPKDSTHDPNDPNTWTINSFKEIRMQVTDGDGKPISVYSNVIDIMSMANVYTWYRDSQDYDLFLNYAKELWEASHSYSISLSDVYYCSGCMDEAAEAREREQLEAAARAEEQGYIVEEGIGMDSVPDQDSGLENESAASPVILSNHNKKAEEKPRDPEGSEDETSEIETAEMEAASAAEETTSAVITAGQSRQVKSEGTSGSETEGEEIPASEAIDYEADDQGTANHKITNHDTTNHDTTNHDTTNHDTTNYEITNYETAGYEMAGHEMAGYESAGFENDDSGSDFGMGNPGSADSEMLESQGSQSQVPGDDVPGSQVPDIQLSEAEYSSGQIVEPSQNPEDATPSNASAKGGEHRTDCPGHIDLIIHMKICGLDETKGLYSLDRTGTAEENITENGWPGWTDETKRYVTELSTQDWFKNYGLSVSVISMLNPLSSSEIEAYLDQLPELLSPERRSLIEFALSSVGKVPYYWGGKASHPDYEGNQFGILVSPDTKGRVLKGLDCSGWISWVYWSATGNRLPYESTSGLAVCGTRIGREQLQPGDIIVRTGSDAHVIMFLGWTENGRILCIHESSAGVNNVTVAVRDANWPYYRKLLD